MNEVLTPRETQQTPPSAPEPGVTAERFLQPGQFGHYFGNSITYQASVSSLTQQASVVDLVVRELSRTLKEIHRAPVRVSLRNRQWCGQLSRTRIDRSAERFDVSSYCIAQFGADVRKVGLDFLREPQALFGGQVVRIHGGSKPSVSALHRYVSPEQPNRRHKPLTCFLLYPTKLVATSNARSGSDRGQRTSDGSDDGAQQQLQPLHAESLPHAAVISGAA